MLDLISSDNPLYGRITYQIELLPFDYYDSSLLIEEMSNEEKINYYSVLGGIPYFYNFLDRSKSFEENIIRLFIKEETTLVNEITYSIINETKKINNANTLLSLISNKHNSYTEIKKEFNNYVKNSDLDYLLKTLINMGIISKTTSINDKKESKNYYFIKENIYDFYYGVIFKKLSFKEYLSDEDFFNMFIKDYLFTEYIPHKFEEISKEFLIRLNKNNLIKPKFFNIGKYFYNDKLKKRNGEFDIVTIDENGYIFYEVKFIKDLVGEGIINEEKNELKELDISYYKLGFISKNGFKKEANKDLYNLFTLDDFYK